MPEYEWIEKWVNPRAESFPGEVRHCLKVCWPNGDIWVLSGFWNRHNHNSFEDFKREKRVAVKNTLRFKLAAGAKI